MPPAYSIVLQESEKASWHVPSITGDDLELRPQGSGCVPLDPGMHNTLILAMLFGRFLMSDLNLINKICSSLLYKSCDSLLLDGREKGIPATFLSTLFFSPFVPNIHFI